MNRDFRNRLFINISNSREKLYKRCVWCQQKGDAHLHIIKFIQYYKSRINNTRKLRETRVLLLLSNRKLLNTSLFYKAELPIA